MKINSLLSSIRHWSSLPVLALAAALAIGGCDVTQPDDDPWRDVTAYSWPTDKVLQYRTDDLTKGTQDIKEIVTTKAPLTYWNGMNFQYLSNPQSRAPRYFLALKDTIVTLHPEFPMNVALVAPLKKGHKWVSGIQNVVTDTGEVVLRWYGEILERYSYRKIEGEVYSNVIEVEYKPEFFTDPSNKVVRTLFYVEGKGVVQELKSLLRETGSSDTPNSLPQPLERVLLIKTARAPGL